MYKYQARNQKILKGGMSLVNLFKSWTTKVVTGSRSPPLTVLIQ